MSSSTLLKHYPNDKNPFHEDVAKSKPKSRIKRTFTNLKESLRGSFRKKAEKQLKHVGTESSGLEGAKQRCTENIQANEVFVIRTRIQDRCIAPTDAYTTHNITTPIPPPRTSSLRKRNRLNSTSSGCSSNPFDDDVTPLFPDSRVTSASRHTLNIPQHSGPPMFGSSQASQPNCTMLRTSCESICTIGGTRRKKRMAPLPPTHNESALSLTITMDKSVAEELQRLQNDIKLMTDGINRNMELLGEVAADLAIPYDHIDLDDNHSKVLNREISHEYMEPASHMSSKVILPKISLAPSQPDTNRSIYTIHTPQIDCQSSNFQPITKTNVMDFMGETCELLPSNNISQLHRDVAVDINSNEVGKGKVTPTSVDTIREKCYNQETRLMKYIDEDDIE